MKMEVKVRAVIHNNMNSKRGCEGKMKFQIDLEAEYGCAQTAELRKAIKFEYQYAQAEMKRYELDVIGDHAEHKKMMDAFVGHMWNTSGAEV